MNRLLVVALAVVLGTAVPQICHAGRPATGTRREVTLSKDELAARRAALAAMTRLQLHESGLRRWQVVISDEGRVYNVAFMRDPVRDLTDNEGCSWDVRKSDMKVIKGPIFYR